MPRLSTKDLILHHLRQNRGREIPLSEIKELYDLKRTTISNAIKELRLLNLIRIDRRPLRRGRFTVIWLTGDNITTKYTHPDATQKGPKGHGNKDPKKSESINIVNDPNETINYLQSEYYRHQQFIREITNLNLQPTQLAFNYFTPLLHITGTLWHEGKISIGQEHLITSRIEKTIFELIPKNTLKPLSTILLSCVEGEMHNISLILLELLLADSHKIINLRRSLPIHSLLEFIGNLNEKIDWIFISITQNNYLGTLKRQVSAIKATFPSLKVAIGGQAAYEMKDATNIDYVMMDESGLLTFLTSLLKE